MARLLLYLLLTGLAVVGYSGLAYAQGHTVGGTVTSAGDNEALPGANVVVKGTTTGTATDLRGRFSFTAPSPNDTLVVSYVGFETQEVPIAGRSTVDVSMSPEAMLEELVVVGYGAQERRDITGAISSVSTREIQELPVTDAGQVLQGRSAGVVALSSGNRPGEGVTIRIRGRRSLTASNDPLYVVDGIPVEGGIDAINPRDIESIEVLKDASATAIYGSRGANGVILVTTSRGGNHPTRVSYSSHVGLSQVLGEPNMMSGAEYAEMKREAWRAITENPRDEDIFTQDELRALSEGFETRYQDLVVDNGYQQNHQVSVEGGDARTAFFVSGNFFDERGIIRTQDFKRYTGRLNLDHTISNRFRVGVSTQVSRVVQNWGSNPYGGAISTNPLSRPFDAEGRLILRPGADPLLFNPLADLEEGNYLDERASVRVFSNLFAVVDLTDDLTYRMNFGPDLQSWRRGLFQGSHTTARNENPPLARKEHVQQFTYTFENILNYRKDLSRMHGVDLTGLFSIQASDAESSFLTSSSLPYETQLFHNIGSGSTIEGLGSNLEEWQIMSFMGRANYRLLDRYLLTLTGRFDGSSRLAEGNKWGFFPSVALGWRLADEPLMLGQELFSELKLRASYGQTGNTAITPYQTSGALTRTAYVFGETPAYGYRPATLANPDLKWEVSAQVNLGLDFGLWDDRVTGSVEVYRTRTSDLLLQRNLPITSGFTSVFENIGKTENRGYEVALATENISSRAFSWSTDLNVFGNREKIVDLYGTGENDVGNEWFIGEALSVWYDYDKLGIWQLDEAAQAASYSQKPGEIKVRDVNGDGVINQEDRVILGSDLPTLTFGMTNRFRYRSVDFSVFLFGSFGHMVFDDFAVGNTTLQGRYNNLSVNYWTPTNPTNEHPRPNNLQERPLYGSTRGYVAGDFLKVRNVQFGYTLPPSVTRNLNLQYLRIYLSADTPLVFSHLEGNVDPELAGGTISGGVVPASRLYTVGVNVNF